MIKRGCLGWSRFIEDAMPVSFRSDLFTSYILTIFKQLNLVPKIWDLPNIFIYACKNITEKNEFVENVLPRKVGIVCLRFDLLRRNS